MPITEFHAPDYFVDGHRVYSIRIDPDKVFANMDEVAELFAGASPHRPSIHEYAQALERQGRLTPAVQEAVEKAEAVRSQTTAVFYIAGPLTGVGEELKARYGVASGLLAEYPAVREDRSQAFFGYVPHLHGTDPVKHPNVTPEEVRDIDYLWAKIVADYHVNFLEPMAHGNAIELGWAESSMIPSANMNPAGNRLSRLTLGMNNVMRLIEYQDFEQDGLRELKVGFDEIHTWLRTFPDRDPREYYFMGYRALGDALLRVADKPFINETGKSFAPNFPPIWFIDFSRMMAYVRNPENPYYGQTAEIKEHGWLTGSGMVLEFPDGRVEEFDEAAVSMGISVWRR